MATCFNKNTAQYKALQSKYSSPLVVDSIIDSWQKASNSDEIPSVIEADNYLNQKKTAFNLKKESYVESLFGNLKKKDLISKVGGEYYINNTAKGSRVADKLVLYSNKDTVVRLLNYWDVPSESVTISPTPNSFKLNIDENIFTKKDIITETSNKKQTNILPIVQNLTRMFPDLTVNVATVKEAEEFYDALPEWRKSKVKFKDVNSYYVGSQVFLIKGRVTTETAIEEVLHPFVDTIYLNNKQLFSGLLSEATEMFPQLKQQIDNSYTDKKGFNQVQRELELVTQSLSRHFNKEYENTPTQGWLQKIVELLKFFSDVVKDLHKFISGNKLQVKPGLIKPNTTLTDIAKILNTSNLEFENISESAVDGKVRFSLTPEKQEAVNMYKSMTQNSVQSLIIDQLTHASTESKEEYSDFTAGSPLTGTDTPLVILEKDTHTYINIETGEEFGSTTTKIKGKLNDPENKYKINRDIGNDFDQIMEHLAELKPVEELPEMNVLNQEQVKRAVDIIQTILTDYRSQGAIIIPQVVIADAESLTAGTIDLLAIHTDGTLQVIDLKASKNSIYTDKYERAYPVDEGSVFYDPALAKKDQFTLSTKAQQNIQVNTYRRILENMGYEVRNTSETLHMLVDVEGFGKDQKFEGTFRYEGRYTHNAMDQITKVNKIVPVSVDQNYAEKIAEQQLKGGVSSEIPLSIEEQLPENDSLDSNTYEALYRTIAEYKTKLVSRREAVTLIKNKRKQSKDNQRVLEEIDNAITDINVGMFEGTADVVYEELLESSIKEFEDFIEYAENPKNFNSPDYIGRISNFESFAITYQGLTDISNKNKKEINLNTRQLKLKDKLIALSRTVLGSEKGDGLITKSTVNFVRQYVVDNSSKDFTEKDLDKLMTVADDIGAIRGATGDLATSKDTLMMLMDQLFKSNQLKVLDNIDVRNNEIRRIASRLEALSPRGKVDYSFMQVLDKDDKFTGLYVRPIGYQYYGPAKDMLNKGKDKEGTPLQYVVHENLEDYTKEEIEFNKKLKAIREEQREFFQAEKKVGKNYVDGDLHKYTDEFKAEREKFEVWKPLGNNGYWEKKRNVNRTAYQDYKNKYYKEIEVNFANYDSNNNFDGSVQELSTMSVVKSKYSETREDGRINGKSILDSKYSKIMNPSTSDSLALAQKEFYEMYIQYFENDLLNKLPSGTRDNMLGKSIVIKDNTIKSVNSKGPLVTSLWAKTTRGMKNFFQKTSTLTKVQIDENGNMIDTLPMFYIGNVRDEQDLKNIDEEINQLTIDFNSNKIDEDYFKLKKSELEGTRQRLQEKPSLEELSTDMADNLLRFSAMAENYEVMGEIEDTLKAMVTVIANRSYNPSSSEKVVSSVKGVLTEVGLGKKENLSNAEKRARKWMKMIYYQNDKTTRGFADKISSALIQAGSLTYVGFNVFGNINNYAVGRINNAIEASGGRYFEGKAYLRAELEFNKKVLPSLIKRVGDESSYTGVTGKGKYKEYVPGTKYEALADLYRMMDPYTDIREQNKARGKESKIRKAMSWAYLLQDGAEYNVQTKIGMAMLMSKLIRNGKGEEISLYDAYLFDSRTGKLTLKEGFDQLVNNKPGVKATIDTPTVEFTVDNRYKIRNNIREVNKQIHGNYASVDRAVIQQHWLGNLGMQFHKWVAPAIEARYGKEYYNENLGWVEGRYRSFYSFMSYALKNVKDLGKITENYKEMKGEKAFNAITGAKRTAAELSFMLMSFAMAAILDGLFDDDDDDKSAFAKRMQNALIFQMNKQGREFQAFLPVFGIKEQATLVGSPIAAIRSVNEITEAIHQSIFHPFALIREASDPSYNMLKDKNYYYQRGSRKGQSKLGKQWGDVVPLWYTYNRYIAYENTKDWYVK
tara:strand:- start:3739 stop:9324 length:5586 start_codon:yes stop_codon:yes gene_type:complete